MAGALYTSASVSYTVRGSQEHSPREPRSVQQFRRST